MPEKERPKPVRLSQTDTGKRAPKWAKILSFYPLIDTKYLDGLYDEGRDERGNPYTTDTPERLKRWYEDMQRTRREISRYLNDPDPAVRGWAQELINFIDDQIKGVYNIKRQYLEGKVKNRKVRLEVEKEQLQERIKEIPEVEDELEKQLKTLQEISKFPK